MTGAPPRTCTDALQQESMLPTTSEIRVRFRKLARDKPQKDDIKAVWADGTVRTEMLYMLPSEVPMTKRDAEQEKGSTVLGAYVSCMTMACVGTSMGTGPVSTISHTRKGDSDEMRVSQFKNAQFVVDRAKCVSINCDLERAIA